MNYENSHPFSNSLPDGALPLGSRQHTDSSDTDKISPAGTPDEEKGGATVYGYSPNKELVVLRKGTNEVICLSDDPPQPGFSVACYHRDLEPFMQRGRELRKEGKSQEEVFTSGKKK